MGNIINSIGLMESYKERLFCNGFKVHVIFYASDLFFEYDPINIKVRPFNSIYWYEAPVSDFTNYFKDLYNREIIHVFKQKNEPRLGSLENNNLVIDLDYLTDIIIGDNRGLVPDYTIFKQLLTSLFYQGEMNNE